MLLDFEKLYTRAQSIFSNQYRDNNLFNITKEIDTIRYLDINNIETILLNTMKYILSFEKENIKFSTSLTEAFLMDDFVYNNLRNNYFSKLFKSVFNYRTKKVNIDNLMKCFIIIFDQLEVSLNDKYNDYNYKIWPDINNFMSVLKAIYQDTKYDNIQNKIKIEKFMLPFIKERLIKMFNSQKYFDLLKILVGFYDLNSRNKFSKIILRLLDDCPYDNKNYFLSAINVKAINENNILQHNSYICRVMMSLIIQVFLKDATICVHSALLDLVEEVDNLREKVEIIASNELPRLSTPIKFSYNISEMSAMQVDNNG